MKKQGNAFVQASEGILSKLPITRTLQFIVSVFVCIVFAVLALVLAGSRLTSGSDAG